MIPVAAAPLFARSSRRRFNAPNEILFYSTKRWHPPMFPPSGGSTRTYPESGTQPAMNLKELLFNFRCSSTHARRESIRYPVTAVVPNGRVTSTAHVQVGLGTASRALTLFKTYPGTIRHRAFSVAGRKRVESDGPVPPYVQASSRRSMKRYGVRSTAIYGRYECCSFAHKRSSVVPYKRGVPKMRLARLASTFQRSRVLRTEFECGLTPGWFHPIYVKQAGVQDAGGVPITNLRILFKKCTTSRCRLRCGINRCRLT